MSDSAMENLKRQMEEMKAKHAEALAMVQAAQEDIANKQKAVESAQQALDQAEATKERAGAEADHALKTASGEKEAKLLAEGLERDGYAFLDNFLGETLAESILDEVEYMHLNGLLLESELAGGKTGLNLRYSASEVRGDLVRFVDGSEPECQTIRLLKELSDQVVSCVGAMVAELKGEVLQRGRLMCTCYPGGPSPAKGCGSGGPCGYVEHCDNPDRNGRRLTTLYYLNKDWVEAHGGQLRIVPSDAKGQPVRPGVDVAPVMDRFLVFYSDRRNPHQVVETKVNRYAITTWYNLPLLLQRLRGGVRYYSAEERSAAVSMAAGEMEVEAERIRREIERNTGKAAEASIEEVKPASAVVDLEELD